MLLASMLSRLELLISNVQLSALGQTNILDFSQFPVTLRVYDHSRQIQFGSLSSHGHEHYLIDTAVQMAFSQSFSSRWYFY